MDKDIAELLQVSIEPKEGFLQLKDDPSNLDSVLLEKLQNLDGPVIPYLLSLCNTVLKPLCISYIGISIQIPEMFNDCSMECLLKPWPPGLADDIVKRFEDDGLDTIVKKIIDEFGKQQVDIFTVNIPVGEFSYFIKQHQRFGEIFLDSILAEQDPSRMGIPFFDIFPQSFWENTKERTSWYVLYHKTKSR